MKFTHSSAYSFGRDNKCKIIYFITRQIRKNGQTNYSRTRFICSRYNERDFTPLEVNINFKLIKRIGTDARSKSYSNPNPGPGQYTVGGYIGKAPKYTMASKSGAVDPNKYIVSPGPGIYTPKYDSQFRNFSYSISGRHNASKCDSTPGPGNYNVRSEKNLEVPSYK